jgi:putative heme-binding domain-containing protein
MRYDKQLIVVEAGKPVAITLENADAMPHNLAILMPGALEEIGNAAEKMPAEPDAEGRLYVPASPKVLHATKLVAPGEKTQLAFSAPDEPGDYPYVCTFPGHWRVMFGTLAVVKDVDAYLASQARVEQPKITEWKLEDLTPELSKVGFGRNLEKGKELVTKLACIQCHKLGQIGYAYGPDLTDVFARYKNDRTNVLQQILEPSKIIEDRYRNITFELSNAEPMTGMILKEDTDTVTIQSGPAESLIQTLKKSEIQQRRAQTSSPMPVGLLNSLSKEQIFDLLAYVESGGKPHLHDHVH